MWRAKSGDPAAMIVASVGDVNVTALQLSLASFRLPVAAHAVFNGLAAAGMWLLGHPVLALVLFVGATAFDAVKQVLIRRWLEDSRGADETCGFRKLALLAFARVTIYTAPTFAMALSGGGPELVFYGLQLATLLAVGVAAGALSRAVFWGFATPMAIQVAALSLILFSPVVTLALGLSALILLAVAGSISIGASTTISAWHQAFVRTVADRAAADAAREAAREASRARAAFLATMSHEIRTPMNGVMGMAQLLQRDERDPVQRERIGVLIDSGEYLLQILNDILDASKIDAGKLEIVTAPEDLRSFLDRAIAFWSPRAAERGVGLSLELDDDVGDRLMLDALRLRQVLFNLIGNALKFTEAGSVTLAARVTPAENGQARLHLQVRDTGPGIPAGHLPSLFDRFTQVDDPAARRVDGTGLGLAIVRDLTHLMGGRVWVESEVGVGSTFHVELTAARLAPERPAAEVEDNAPQPLAMPALRVLAVDDNAINLLVLEQLLTSLGHTVSKASGGEAALDALAEETFDLVLTDIQMPAMTGSQLLLHIRAAPGPNQDVPVIALTADVTSGGRQRYLDEGFTEHAAKPIQLQDLLGAILRAVSAQPDTRAERVA